MEITNEKLEQELKKLPEVEILLDWDGLEGRFDGQWIFESETFAVDCELIVIEYQSYTPGNWHQPAEYETEKIDVDIKEMVVWLGEDEIDVTVDQYKRIEEVIKNLISCS